MNDPFKAKGFTTITFDEPFAVTFFSNLKYFNPAKGTAVGVEICNQFGTERLIVRYEKITRRVSGVECHWPNGLIYLYPDDIEDWKPGQRAKIG